MSDNALHMNMQYKFKVGYLIRNHGPLHAKSGKSFLKNKSLQFKNGSQQASLIVALLEAIFLVCEKRAGEPFPNGIYLGIYICL